MAVVGITGGTGLVGHHLVPLLLGKGHQVVIFSRSVSGRVARPGVTYALLDADNNKCDTAALHKINAVIHLAGEPVAAKRWTAKQKQLITSSRVEGTQFLVAQLRAHAPNCKTLVGASGMGYYGPDNGSPFTEDKPPYDDFLGNTSRLWEAEEQKAADFLRVIVLRIAIVLGNEGGAFPEFVKPLSFGVAPILGGGKQVISWIHVQDLARLFVYAIENTVMAGAYNATTPTPVTNRALMKELTTVKGGFYLPIPVPSFLLKAILGEMSIEILKSCTASAAKTLAAGFVFQYPTVTAAIKNLLGK